MATPRVGIVGTPDQISILVPILVSLKVQVTALWCKGSETRRKLSEKFLLPYLSGGFQELLIRADVDLVYVATEPSLQAELAVKALTSGKHCICQKPPCNSRKEVEKMVSLSRYYSQLICLLESHLHFLPAIRKMKELVSSGYVGEPLVIEARVVIGSLIQSEPYSWKCDSGMGGGVLNMVGSHIIDLISYVSGHQAKKVHATLHTFCPHTENIYGYRTVTSDDFCCFQMQCGRGLSATVTLNSLVNGQYSFEFSITGTKERLVVKGLNLYGTRHGSKVEDIILQQDRVDFSVTNDLPTNFPVEFYLPKVLGCKDLFGILKKVIPTPENARASVQLSEESISQALSAAATFEDGLYIRTVLDALHLSSRTGLWVDVPKLDSLEDSNPFWPSSSGRLESADKSSPEVTRPVFV